MKKLILFTMGAVIIAGCGEKLYTVDELKKDDAKRNEILAKCKNGELHYMSQICDNAHKAIPPQVYKF